MRATPTGKRRATGDSDCGNSSRIESTLLHPPFSTSPRPPSRESAQPICYLLQHVASMSLIPQPWPTCEAQNQHPPRLLRRLPNASGVSSIHMIRRKHRPASTPFNTAPPRTLRTRLKVAERSARRKLAPVTHTSQCSPTPLQRCLESYRFRGRRSVHRIDLGEWFRRG